METPDVRYESGVLAPKRPWVTFDYLWLLSELTRQYFTLLLVPGVQINFLDRQGLKFIQSLLAAYRHLEKREPSGRVNAHVQQE